MPSHICLQTLISRWFVQRWAMNIRRRRKFSRWHAFFQDEFIYILLYVNVIETSKVFSYINIFSNSPLRRWLTSVSIIINLVAETDDVRQNTCDDIPINEVGLYSYYTKSYLWRLSKILNKIHMQYKQTYQISSTGLHLISLEMLRYISDSNW